jgi:para-aminobenzoate synthetase component 1
VTELLVPYPPSHCLIYLSVKPSLNKKPSNHVDVTVSVEPLLLADGVTSLPLFSCLADQHWAIWLDSCDSNHVDSRYDIIVWQPKVTLSTYGKTTQIRWHQQVFDPIEKTSIGRSKRPLSGRCYDSKQDPLALVKDLQQQVFRDLTLPDTELPFVGGALGYFGYDLARRFEKVPEQAENDIQLPEMAIGIYTQAIIFDRKTQQTYLVCPAHQRLSIEAYLADKMAQFAQSKLSKQHKQYKQSPSDKQARGSVFKLTTRWQSNMTQAAYGDKFDQVKDYLLSGDCYQINLAQRFSAHYQGDEFEAYLQLRANNQAPFSAFIRLDQSAILSISPERFLQLHQGQVQSKPIKGTRARSKDPVVDQANAIALKHAPKDRAENLMIVDLLRNDISKTCVPGSVRVPSLFNVESFPAVHHLVSTVVGQLAAKYDGTDLLREAFPGGSITGAPKIRAMQIIEQLEPHRRSVYCGSIGYLSACGNMDTSITIRTLVAEKDTLYCWAGGGLVADSQLASEYQETFDKVSHILPVLTQLNADEDSDSN